MYSPRFLERKAEPFLGCLQLGQIAPSLIWPCSSLLSAFLRKGWLRQSSKPRLDTDLHALLVDMPEMEVSIELDS